MRVYPPVPANHPWKKNATLPRYTKTEEDIAVERFDNVDDRLDQQLEKDSISYGGTE